MVILASETLLDLRESKVHHQNVTFVSIESGTLAIKV